MNESDFNILVDETLMNIEEALDACDTDIDYESSNGILTLIFTDQSRIIINRQTPIKQLWLAAKNGGYHFDYRGGEWICDKTGKNFLTILNNACSEQANENVELDLC